MTKKLKAPKVKKVKAPKKPKVLNALETIAKRDEFYKFEQDFMKRRNDRQEQMEKINDAQKADQEDMMKKSADFVEIVKHFKHA